MSSLPNDTLRCDLCDFVTIFKTTYDKHIVGKAHKAKLQVKSEENICPYCEQKFSEHCNLKRHIPTCKKAKELMEKNEQNIKHINRLETGKIDYENDINALHKKLANITELYKQQKSNINNLHEELADIKHTHEQELNSMKQECENYVADLTKRHNDEIAEMENKLSTAQQTDEQIELIDPSGQMQIVQSIQSTKQVQQSDQTKQLITSKQDDKTIVSTVNNAITNNTANNTANTKVVATNNSQSLNNVAYCNNKINNLSVSALNYVKTNYATAPLLKEFADADIARRLNKSDKEICEEICTEFKISHNSELGPKDMEKRDINKRTSAYLANIIIEEYTTDLPDEQSMWNCDKDRHNYVIRSSVKNSEEWITDSNAKYIIATIIEPLLKYIEHIIETERIDIAVSNLKTFDNKLLELGNARLNFLICLEEYLINANTTKYILKHLSPSFNIKKVFKTHNEKDEVNETKGLENKPGD
jgi:hypothetical protein